MSTPRDSRRLIRLNDFERQWKDTREASIAALTAVGESGWYILGREVAAFEAELAACWGLMHCVGVASGLDAIEIGLRVLGCGRGDKVLTTPVSAFATTLAILKIGAVPVFADVDRYGLIDLDACEALLESDGAIRYFVPVHLYGAVLDLERLCRIQARFGCRIVEDCAQSIGARFRGRACGTVGEVAATSFYPTKNLGAMGDGGAILTGHAELAARAAALRDYGQTAKYVHAAVGYNSRLDELQAAILRRAMLPRLPRCTARRREIAARYLAGIKGVQTVGAPAGADSCWHLFPVLTAPERKPAFIKHLAASGIACGEHYPTPIPDQKAMAEAPFAAPGGFAAARRLCAAEVSIPIHPYLGEEEVEAVITACNAWEA